MKSLLYVALVSTLISAPSYITIEFCLDSNGYAAIEFYDRWSFSAINGKREKLFDKLRAPVNTLELPFILTENSYLRPIEVAGIEQDIPFNYHATLDASAEYIYGLINNGFRVSVYQATSRVIYMELLNESKRCRILVYDGYLKVYMPEGE